MKSGLVLYKRISGECRDELKDRVKMNLQRPNSQICPLKKLPQSGRILKPGYVPGEMPAALSAYMINGARIAVCQLNFIRKAL